MEILLHLDTISKERRMPDIESIRKIINDLNARIVQSDGEYLNDVTKENIK